MKYLLTSLVILSAALLSCREDAPVNPLQDGNGCVERRVLRVTGHSIATPAFPVVKNLFVSNGIDDSRYRYYQYSRDSVQTYFPPYAKFDSKVVRVDQYVNGLRILNAELVFGFKNEVFSHRAGVPITSTALDTVPHLTIGQLRKRFIEDVERFEQAGRQYQDTCVTAEFGYFVPNAGADSTPAPLIKAWRVTRKNAVYPAEYPQACYRDSDGSRIYYDDGIKTIQQ